MKLLLRHSQQAGVLGLAFVLALGFAAADEQATQLSITSRDTITPVVELYTSEGCSSCPRADNFITELGKTFDREFHAVALAFHVDYWNYLGWLDPYSKPEFTARQRKVGSFNKQQSIYTPEIVVAGKESRGGVNVVERIKQNNKQQSVVTIRLNLQATNDQRLAVVLAIDNQAIGSDAVVYTAIYENNIVRDIGGGENKGRMLTHNYVVRYWSDPLQLSHGLTQKRLSLNLDKEWAVQNLGFAVVVLNRENGKTLQALNTPLHTLFSI